MPRLLMLALFLAATLPAFAADEKPAPKKLSVLVLTGGHDFDTATFPKVFDGHPGIIASIVDQKDAEPFEDISNWKYDVIVLYNFNQKISEKRRANFLALLEKGVGLVILHHAIAAFPEWPEFDQILGARYHLKAEKWNGQDYPASGWQHDVVLPVKIADPSHPIVAGLSEFSCHDESYNKYTVLPTAKVVLTTTAPLNDKTLGWYHTYKSAKVCYLQLGHGKETFVQKEFGQLVANAIRWSAK